MLRKIISGGQCGVDLAGLRTAKRLGLQTGGTMPKGFRTKLGNRPWMADTYGCTEHRSSDYPPRTYANVRDSDATLRLATDFQSPGERATLKALLQYGRPHYDVNLASPVEPHLVWEWLVANNVQTLNVAGNARVELERAAEDYLVKVLENVNGDR